MFKKIFLGLAILLTFSAAFSLVYAADKPNKQQAQTAAESKNAESETEETFWERTTNDPVAFFTAWLGLFTAVLSISTIALWWTTKNASASQSRDMQASLVIADRHAAETARMVSVLETNARKQIRAYLSVSIGENAIYQDDRYFFEAKPALTNSGFTPAHNISYWAKADIFPHPLPDGFTLPEDKPAIVPSNAILAPHHSFELNALLEKRVPDGEVDNIKFSKGMRLYVWGCVHYDDVFGVSHYTNFFHSVGWLRNNKTGQYALIGNYQRQHNDSN